MFDTSFTGVLQVFYRCVTGVCHRCFAGVLQVCYRCFTGVYVAIVLYVSRRKGVVMKPLGTPFDSEPHMRWGYVTGVLQVCYRCFTCALLACHMCFTGVLHEFYRCSTGVLHVFYMCFTGVLHVYMWQSPCMCPNCGGGGEGMDGHPGSTSPTRADSQLRRHPSRADSQL